ncbi:hypothetical protein BJX66DRAFT_338340 [Aspergillus keveii]|uniref:Uncharacterized protein n=1 Tax=Aspergillus keveii TaxID=714993 RepID=A0ABR4G4G0_9EURO
MSAEEDVSSANRIVRLAKLVLDEEEEPGSSDPLLEIKNALRNVGRMAREAVTDYLTHVLMHTRQALERCEGFYPSWEVELALCVPSKWSTYAHLTMQEIALDVTAATGMQGGNFSLFIIDEPEAAATFALRADALGAESELKEGSNFIDVITYRVRQTGPVCFDEITTPTGKDCGSSYMNQALGRETMQRLADVTDLRSDKAHSTEPAIQVNFWRDFEYELKRAYDPDELEDGEWTAVDSKLDQVEGQEVKTLLLVGGFSRSPALRECLKREFKTLQIVHAWDDIVLSHPLNGREYVKECIEWALRKDRVLGQGENATTLMHRVFDVVYPHYEKDHWRKTVGHREAGVVEANLDFLRESNMIPKLNEKGKEYYEVDYSLELEVNGRNMKVIRYPPGQQVQGENQICIAAAFKPGTK